MSLPNHVHSNKGKGVTALIVRTQPGSVKERDRVSPVLTSGGRMAAQSIASIGSPLTTPTLSSKTTGTPPVAVEATPWS